MDQIAYTKLRPAKPDIWLTVSGWLWLTYGAAMLALIAAAVG